jgi:hypothetical protein
LSGTYQVIETAVDSVDVEVGQVLEVVPHLDATQLSHQSPRTSPQGSAKGDGE